jgi:hypothetical protein
MNKVVYEETNYRKRAIEYTLRVILESFVSVSKSTLTALYEKKYILRPQLLKRYLGHTKSSEPYILISF